MAELPAIGSVVADKYRIEALLGEGGMGAVFRARHQLMDNVVALKWLQPSLAKNAEAKERFMREARAAARIRHPHVVDVYDVGVHEGSLFMVMELLEGESFESLLTRGNISISSAVGLLIEAMRGVDAAHRRGIVHRDIKPENIFIVRDAQHPAGIAKVLDFGISKLKGVEKGGQHLTQTGSTMGTPLYMSYEQMNGARDVDERTDIYAFGVLLYRALTGKLPFDGDTFAIIAVKVATQPPAAAITLRPELPAELDAVIMKAIAQDRTQRQQTMQELIDALTPFGPQPEVSPSARPPSPMSATLGATMLGPAGQSWSDLPIPGSASRPSESFQASGPRRGGRARLGLAALLSVSAALGLALLWRAVSHPATSPPAAVGAVPKPPSPPLAPVAPAGSPASDVGNAHEDWSNPPATTPSLALSPEGGAEGVGTASNALERPSARLRPAQLAAPDAGLKRESGRVSAKAGESVRGDKASVPASEPTPALKPQTAEGQRSGSMSRDEFR